MGAGAAYWLNGNPAKSRKRPIKLVIQIYEATKDPNNFWNDIAKKYGVSYACVKQIARKKTNQTVIELYEAGKLDLDKIGDDQLYL